ncbi:MAG: NAD-dependent epimerase/dehydratase family protein [Actinomycetota bacterium]
MKIDVVTGACGFVGSHLVKQLVQQGRRVRATDLPCAHNHPEEATRRRILDLDYERDGVEWVPSDLTRPETLAPLFAGGDVGCLFHTASLYDYAAPWEALERVNIHGVTNLLAAAQQGGIERMIHWSTCGVYGHPYFPGSHLEGRPHRSALEFLWNQAIRPWQKDPTFRRPQRHPTNQPMTENRSTPKNTDAEKPAGTYFSNDYSRSKWLQEQIVWRHHRDHGLPVTVVRPAPVYGPGSTYGVTGLLIALSEGVLPVYPAASKFLLFGGNIHVRDVARAAVFLSERPESIGEDYNLSDGYLLTHREAFETAAGLLGRRVHFIPGVPLPVWQQFVVAVAKTAAALEKRFPGYTRSRVLDLGQLTYLTIGIWVSNRKLRDLGFEFDYPDFRDGLAETVAWLIETGAIQ